MFPSPSAKFDNQTWWRDLVGELPETKNTQPRTGEQVETGHYGDGNLVLNTHAIRIDWRYRVDELAFETSRIPTLGNFQQAVDKFRDLMNRWLGMNDTPSFVRLAFGVDLIHPVDRSEEVYSVLKKYLPFDVDLKNASDFLYQINRRRDANVDIPSLSINRLSKWSGLKMELTILQPIQQSPTKLFAARLELDINTADDFEDEIPPSKTEELFQELIALGEEISRQGDIP